MKQITLVAGYGIMKAFPVTAAAKSAFKQVQVLPRLPDDCLRHAMSVAASARPTEAVETDPAILALRANPVSNQNAPQIIPS